MTKLAPLVIPQPTGGAAGIGGPEQTFRTALEAFGGNLLAILDGGVSFDDNMDVSRVSVQSHATPGTEFSVAHELGKVPLGYIVAGQTAAGSVYDGTSANTKTTLYLKSDAASTTFRLIVF